MENKSASFTQCIYCHNFPKISLKVPSCNHLICYHCIQKILLSYTFQQKKINPFIIPCKAFFIAALEFVIFSSNTSIDALDSSTLL